MSETTDATWQRIGRFICRAVIDPLVGRKDVSPRLESAIERAGTSARQAVRWVLENKPRPRGRPPKPCAKETLAQEFADAHAKYPRRTLKWIVEDVLGRANATNAYDAILEGIDLLAARGVASPELLAAKRSVLEHRKTRSQN